MIPTPIPIAKPVSTHTHDSWVRVQTDTGKDRVKNTHGLPVPITRARSSHNPSPTFLFQTQATETPFVSGKIILHHLQGSPIGSMKIKNQQSRSVFSMLEGNEVFDLQDFSSSGSESDVAYEVESASESDYSDSDYMGDDEGSSRKRSNRHPGEHPSDRQQRSILASTTLSRVRQITREKLPAETSLFTFLDNECYTCSCLTPSSPKARCTVLGFFQLLFLQSCNAIFCPLHNCIIPPSKLERHLCKAHKEWTSPQKSIESRNMALHIATTCGLDTSQEADDVVAQLPDELEEPPVSKGICRRYQCPFCRSWLGENTGPGTPERYLRKHVKEHHSDKMDIDVGESQWTYRVAIYSEGSTHVFMLPDEWTPEDFGDDRDSNLDVSIPPLSTLSTHPDQSSIATAVVQDWPVRLGWELYASEIKAGAHIKELKKLIGLCKSRKDGRLTNFLDKGLKYVRHFSVRYMKGAGLIMESSVIHLGRALVSE